ncbi:MAG: PQQ-binding-like beta-propeller repeat protein [Sedimentisphaerales bacterium]|nr:PQQ-binding-like beta-propeller repeat protein [Sedimentisphaerales bacterium]
MSRIRFLPSLVVLLGILCYFSPALPGQSVEWPCWRGPNRDGKSADTGLLKEWPEGGPELLWKVSDIGNGFSTVAVCGGFIYTTGDVDRKLILFAFDMNGTPKWNVPVDAAWTKSHPGSRSTPTVDGDRLYVLSGNGVMVCFDAKTGDQKWSKDLKRYGGRPGGWGYAESVLIYDNLAIAKPGGRSCVVALDKINGETVWQSKGFTAGPEYGSCVPFTFGGIPMIATGTKEGIACFSLKTGQVLWSNDWSAGNTANCPDPAISDGYVFWANGYRKGGICLKLAASGDKVSAEQVWTTNDMDCHHGGYIIHEGYIYGNHSAGWSCLDLKTGERKWNERAVGKGSVCFADGMLYLFGESGGKAALATCSPEGLTIKGNVTVEGSGPSWAHPVVVGGRLYLRYADNLYCFNMKAKAL